MQEKFKEFSDVFNLVKNKYQETDEIYNSLKVLADESISVLISEDDLSFTNNALDFAQIAVENPNYIILAQGPPSLNSNEDKEKIELLTYVFEKDIDNLTVSIDDLNEINNNLDKVKEIIEPALSMATVENIN